MIFVNNDWRLFREQEKYLKDAVLVAQKYKPYNPQNDHDHCEFCMTKFSSSPEDLHFGYSTKDRKIWICKQCFDDFKGVFNWSLEIT